jgi:hypothetical protein
VTLPRTMSGYVSDNDVEARASSPRAMGSPTRAENILSSWVESMAVIIFAPIF